MANQPDQHHTEPRELFVATLTSCQRRIYAYIVSLVGDHHAANDVLQETNIVLWRKRDDYVEGTDFVAWAMRIAHFQVLAHWRNQQRDRHLFNDEVLARLSQLASDENRFSDERFEALRHCVNNLSQQHRRLIPQRYQEGVSIKHLATQFGRSPTAITKVLHKISKTPACLHSAAGGGSTGTNISNADNPNPRQLDELVSQFIDGQLSADQQQALADLLLADEQGARDFLDVMELHANLTWMQQGQEMSPSLTVEENILASRLRIGPYARENFLKVLDRQREATTRDAAEKAQRKKLAREEADRWQRRLAMISGYHPTDSKPATRRIIIPKPLFYGGIAAMIAIVITLAINFRPQQTQQPIAEEETPPQVAHVEPDPPQPETRDPRPEIIATIGRTINADWDKTVALESNMRLREGSRFTLTEGFIELIMQRGARVVLEAPCVVELIDDNRLRLDRGRLIANVPPAATRFTVDTPVTQVVDIGTEFGVEVKDDQTTDVQVLSGMVEATLTDASGNVVKSTPLTSGWAARFASGTNEIRLGRARPNDFIRDAAEQNQRERLIRCDFEQDDPDQTGGFDHSAGEGWVGPWQFHSRRAQLNVSAEATRPLGWDSSRYITAAYKPAGANGYAALTRQYDWHGRITRDTPHRIRFFVRVNGSLDAGDGFDGRVSIFDDPQRRIGSIGTNTWSLFAFGDPVSAAKSGGTGDLAVKPWSWSFYDGDGQSRAANAPADYSRIVDSNVAVVTGQTYEFEITVWPQRSEWDVLIVHGNQTYSSREALGRSLRFRSGATQTGGTLHFHLRHAAAGVGANISIDDVLIEPLE